ncbi:MAG: ABC transporter ATP-binding protein [Tagaea sp.]|nr:ABC transporter ATP-binding protein [Tagaea sp.]
MSVAIRLANCAKTFPDGTRALAPLDLDVAPGETLAVLGPSGCGKTTALRIVAGLDFPDPGGKVLIDGEDVTDLPIEKRNVGMVFQSYALFPNMSVAQNVAYGLKVRRRPSAEIAARVREMLAMTRLEDLAQRRVDQLSGGQRQRVALARAIAPAPRILLLDEPLTALDAKLRDRLRADIDRLLRSLGITAIYVTHDQAEAMALGDRVVVMDKGRVAQIGRPADIYENPRDEFVAGFVGTTNRLDGRLFRPEAVRADPAGPHAGRVVSAFYLGDRRRIVIDVAGANVIAEVPVAIQLAPGADFRFAIDRYIEIARPC